MDDYETRRIRWPSRLPTGLIYHPSKEHFNIWNENFPECPERAEMIYERLSELHLIERCSSVNPDSSINITKLIEKLHPKENIEKLRKNCEENRKEQAEACYDSVYYNGAASIENAKKSALCCLSLASEVAKNKLQNGFAVVRPPGHHAHTEPNGYCIFNNVALTAQYLLDSNLSKKILIIDFDIHHAQGTQRFFYENKNVLYFSIHRYEHGKYWPHLKESHSSYIGSNQGVGYNVNVPLNEPGLGDTEYIAIVLNILIPIAYRFNPDIILVSAGYDSCFGCPKGEMKVTPAFYGHLITLLGGIADGKIVCVLEGGYYRPSLAEGVAMTLKALLGDPCTPLKLNDSIRLSVIDSINDVRYYLSKWFCCGLNYFSIFGNDDPHVPVQRYYGVEPQPPYIMNDTSMKRRPDEALIEEKLKLLKSFYHKNRKGVLWMCDNSCELQEQLEYELKIRLETLPYYRGGVQNFVRKLYTNDLNFGVAVTLTNNSTIMANMLLECGAKKVMIIDLDNHKTNDEKEGILYVKLSEKVDIYEGTNNITLPTNFNLEILCEILLPLAYSYRPNFIIITKKFGDKTAQIEVTKLGHFIQLLKPIANIIVTEQIEKNDKYVHSFTEMCLKILLGDTFARMGEMKNISSVPRNLMSSLKMYWPILRVNKKISTKRNGECIIA